MSFASQIVLQGFVAGVYKLWFVTGGFVCGIRESLLGYVLLGYDKFSLGGTRSSTVCDYDTVEGLVDAL